MDFRKLIYFVTTIDEGSFTKAAEKLYISQPALSKMIKSLENDVGYQLIYRGNNYIELTPVGSLIYDKAKYLNSEFCDFSNYIKNLSVNMEGKIVVGLPPVIGTCLIPDILPKFIEMYPLINLTFIESGAEVIKEYVLSEKIDMGLGILPINTNIYKTIPLIEGDISLVVYNEHPLANKTYVQIKDFENDNLLLLNESFQLHTNILNAFKHTGKEPNIVRSSISWDLLIALTEARQGITILPTLIVEKYKLKNSVSIRIEDELLKWNIVIVIKKNKILSRLEKVFIDFFSKNIRV